MGRGVVSRKVPFIKDWEGGKKGVAIVVNANGFYISFCKGFMGFMGVWET
jgi:hypothetical protein